MIALVGCSMQKLDRPAPARELYTSVLFRKSLAYAERIARDTYIISAEHHLVPLDTVIAPYDLVLASMQAREVRLWGHRVVERLKQRHRILDMTVLAGSIYVDAIRDALTDRFAFVTPMHGLTIGRRLQWLNARLSEEHAKE